MRYELIAILAFVFIESGPASTAAAPRARKGTTTTTGARSTAKPTKKRKGMRMGKLLRKGKVPASKLEVRHRPIGIPSAELVGSKRARSPLSFRALRKPAKVSFAPCSSALPPQAPQPAATSARPGMDAAISERSYRWPNGATLAIGFVDGSPQARKAVRDIAKEWTKHANITFDVSLGSPPANADILIRFDAATCDSFLGTSSKYYTERGEPSMNLCHLDQQVGTPWFERVVLHEFGHALSLHHEHQSSGMNVRWNKEAVYSYYETSAGWSRDFVDMWVFRRISPQVADSSAYDPDSVMHYSFPPEFTVDGVALGGASELSATDKSFIGEVYPGRNGPASTRRYERKIAVRNETGRVIEVQSVYETTSGKARIWAPDESLDDAPVVRVPKGAERMLDGVGRRLKLVARSVDGHSTWSQWATTPLRIAPTDGYLDGEIQTYVVVIDGPADPPKKPGKDELYASATKALQQGHHDEARALFTAFTERFASDRLAPWAQFNIAVSWYDEGRSEEALKQSYALIIDHPNADPTPYAWFYGGLSALGTGWCEGARSYFEYAAEERSGLPSEWRETAGEYIGLIEKNPKRWCW